MSNDEEYAETIQNQIVNAREVLKKYCELEDSVHGSTAESIQNLMTALMHLAQKENLEPFHIIVEAQSDYIFDIS